MSFVNKPITHILCSPQMTWLCPATYQTMRSFSWGRGIISLISTDWWEKRTGQCIDWVSVSLTKEDWLTDRFLSFQWNSFRLVFCFCFNWHYVHSCVISEMTGLGTTPTPTCCGSTICAGSSFPWSIAAPRGRASRRSKRHLPISRTTS